MMQKKRAENYQLAMTVRNDQSFPCVELNEEKNESLFCGQDTFELIDVSCMAILTKFCRLQLNFITTLVT